MWKWLHPYAKTENAYQLCLTLQPWFWVGAGVCLTLGTIWGLAFAPQDYQQGDSFRIIYIHVPSAILSMSTCVAMANRLYGDDCYGACRRSDDIHRAVYRSSVG